jgi:hypothetical protein
MATTLSKSNPTQEADQTGSPNASLRAVPIRLRRRRGSDAGRDSGDDDSSRVRAPVRPAIRAARAYRRAGDRRGEPPRRSAGAPSKEMPSPGRSTSGSLNLASRTIISWPSTRSRVVVYATPARSATRSPWATLATSPWITNSMLSSNRSVATRTSSTKTSISGLCVEATR